MLFSWLKRRRRRALLSEPFPPAWLATLQRNVALYATLAPTEQARLRDAMCIFIHERSWEGCGGLLMTDEIKVTIAGNACILLLGIEHDYFSHVPSILVYPSGYRAPGERRSSMGVVDEGASGRLGEAWYRGPVVLAWDSVLDNGRHPRAGHNVVLHEFAHQLDFLDGYGDGTPPLGSKEELRRWHEVMLAEFNRLVQASQHGRADVIDDYGATNPAEFFAVVTESFFDKPVQLKHRHPALYEALQGYYKQDPAARMKHPHGENVLQAVEIRRWLLS